MAKPAKPESEKSVKKSVSFRPDLWEFVEKQTGDTGAYSKVVQKAVQLMKDAEEASRKKKT